MSEVEKFIEEIKGLRRIVINDCYGGFSLSDAAVARYKQMAGITHDDFYDRLIDRDDAYLVKIVREMGADANGSCANLKIVEIPEDVSWHIGEYDGAEWVAEDHRTWG